MMILVTNLFEIAGSILSCLINIKLCILNKFSIL